MALSYKDAGVDTRLKDAFVDQIKSYVRRTHTPRVIDNYGAFAGLFALSDNSRLFKKTYRDPVLVSSTDGVGTKLMIAFATGVHSTVGIDLVAMSVNDLITTGAEPLFFLDYIASEKIEPGVHRDIVYGVCEGCRQARCALIGGETAQMPGMYKPGEYDMAGAAIGVIERRRILAGRNVEAGDVLIGLRSSGLHSNGYSLVRKVLFDAAKMTVEEHVPQLGCSLGVELLKPTRIYARTIREVVGRYKVKKPIKAIANITGGGFEENVPRVLPRGFGVTIRRKSWSPPPIFRLIKRLGRIGNDEMYRTFNMGVGMVLVVSRHFADPVMKHLAELAEDPVTIGHVREGERGVAWE
jgi:phosphoribosylformylglycinamidine cyclo-ligase